MHTYIVGGVVRTISAVDGSEQRKYQKYRKNSAVDVNLSITGKVLFLVKDKESEVSDDKV